jgi:hypothetical protein
MDDQLLEFQDQILSHQKSFPKDSNQLSAVSDQPRTSLFSG